MQRYLCIHGHFYQPPRENPWLEAIEVQDSAYPYHDWNQRITAECYAPNAASRILDGEHRIERIVNNYSQISFNFGPSLLAWLEVERPDVYRAILDADALSAERFSGHGSALAQGYNHIILPLANRRDKRSQILWGLADFAHRFKRPAEGMWLPETAVDLETLDLLAQAGVRFTILEPHQARRVRPKGAKGKEGEWKEVGGGRIDPSLPYEVRLREGRRIAVFFFDGAISRAVAFEGLLISGERFADRLMSAVPADPEHDRLINIATDGETYGHHHRYGEMALSYALQHIEENGWAKLTNYGEYLASHPPEHEVEIVENTAWSCVHGVDRWREDCGCHTGGDPGWSQAWRAPLRQALDGLRDGLAPAWERAARELFAAPWQARDAYVEVLLDRSPAAVDAFLAEVAADEPPQGADRVRALQLLELQRHALLMYTSCGWFFNDLAGIETVQVLRYAGRVAQLAGELLGVEVEPELLRRLERAKSNVAAEGSGRDLYERIVRPSAVALPQVAAHYAVSALFEDYPDPVAIYCYAIERERGRVFRAGRARLSVGIVRVTSRLTGETGRFVFGVLHFWDHNLNAGVTPAGDPEEYAALLFAASAAFEHGDLPQAIRLLDRHFGAVPYSLKSLFRDEQRRILDRVLASTLHEVEDEYRDIFEQQAPLMRFLRTLGTPLPKAFAAAAEFVLNIDLRRALADPAADPEEVERLLAERAALGVDLDVPGLSYALEHALAASVEQLRGRPRDTGLLRRIDATVALARSTPFQVDLRQAQNGCYDLLQTVYPERRDQAGKGDAAAIEWVELFRRVGEGLAVRVE
jgi:alpha-amylase/alpha-mannosidase (GH57 family)